MLELCDNRMVLFDNKTKDKRKKAAQVQKLLSHVDSISRKNNGKPFTDELFHELQVIPLLIIIMYSFNVCLKQRMIIIIVIAFSGRGYEAT